MSRKIENTIRAFRQARIEGEKMLSQGRIMIAELNTRCKKCKYEDTQQLDPKTPLACPKCGAPLCVTGFQVLET